MNTDHAHDQETEKLWQESENLPFVKGLKEGKTVAEIMEQLDYQRAFKESPTELGCADGRCTEHRCGGAGAFILASEAEQAEFVRQNKGKIKVVKSHDGCGAAAIKFAQINPADLPVGVTTSDQLGQYYCKKLAEKLGADYAHTSAREMSGSVHKERTIYFDGEGKFNPAALPELPAGFMSSGSAVGMSDEYMQTELETLAKIALGEHGFGKRFTQENPLYIVVSAKDQQQLKALTQIAENAAKQFQGRLKVDGFIA